ncbi:DNA polymerase I [Fusobacterium mortiferum]|uniref:DNA polymerase I n=1 Tax=Fusobacterium mortiferum TaxID=850 RepID=UPI000E4457FF|nr:DNA polymerase I [Fusobacterium mortiferum]RGM98621.1 DNA polymerase I [Fusobacterium mortiferum]RHF67073.1 DNA polymerase I [Fusobacterium mortiferum]
MEKKKAVLLDVSAIMYRAYFANMNFRTKTEPTGAVYGFVNTLMSIIKEFSPDYIGAAFDVKRASLKRSEIYKEYKAQRESAPEDLIAQIPRIEELLDCYNIERFKIEGYEADDVLGTLAKNLSAQGVEVYVVTGDKDLAQILDENINIALLGKGEGGDKFKIIRTDEDVIEYLGVPSKKIPDLFGLIGDSSDGIPGVRKIGPKKAIPMLEKYETLEGIYENIDKLTEIAGIGKSLVNNLVEDKEIAFMSRELAIICQDVPLEFNLKNLSYDIDNIKLLELFKILEFKALIKKMGLENGDEKTQEIEKSKRVSKERTFKVVEGKADIKDMVKSLKKVDLVSCYYTEYGIAFSSFDKDYYFPFGKKCESKIGANISLFDPTPVVEDCEINCKEIQEFFDNYNGEIVTYNLKNILNRGISVKNCKLDMMIAYHLISSQTKENVELPIEHLTGIELDNYADKFGKEKPENISAKEYGKYLCQRTMGLLECYDILKEELEDRNLMKVLNEIEMPLIEILSSMEIKGIKIDPEYFSNYEKELGDLIEKLQEKIYEEAGEEFNINSPKQLAEILFFKLNLPPVKKTKTGLSTDEEVLEKLKVDGAEIAKAILEYRKLAKLKNTYVDAIPKLRDEKDRVHTTFNQIGTTTGRLSSSDPNLQNIPVKTDEGIKIRQGFVAEKNSVLMGIDYSQIELRVLAQLSGDENLREAYQNSMDLHSLTARKIFELSDEEEVSREERIIAKTINFSIIYGKTAFGLAKELGISQKEASEYIDRYFNQYPKVKGFEKEIVEFTEKHGYTETFFGRRRLIDGINSKNKNIKSQAERMAVNSVIQGTAAEIIKKVMIEIYKYIKDRDGISLLLQVHDELIFEIEKEKLEMYREDIEKIMRESVKFDSVPLEINTNIGVNWAETK